MQQIKETYIGLVDADLLDNGTRHPNLTLLKLAGFLHDNEIKFELIYDPNANIDKYDLIYLSKVFTFTQPPKFYTNALGTNKIDKFRVGGTGFYANEANIPLYAELRKKDMESLENDTYLNTLTNYRSAVRKKGIDMAAQMPYYHLYDEYINFKVDQGKKRSYYKDYLYYSIGFLTRGCFRHCPFCVNKLESSILPYSKIEWFLDDERDENGRLIRPYIYLWDDNFLASSPEVWRPLLQQLMETQRPFQFRQGLDERIIAESPYGKEIAETLSKCKYHGDYIFAFDNWRDKDNIIKALKIWKSYNPKKETKFYLFCGFKMKNGDNEALFKDIKLLFERIKILMQYGCFGYVMRHADYEKHEISNIYVQIARWCNQPQFYRYMSFWEYCYRNQSFWEQKSKNLDVPNQISFEEFEERMESGYYYKDGMKLCKTMRTLVNFMNRFPEHREEILNMFNYKLNELANPSLWNNKE